MLVCTFLTGREVDLLRPIVTDGQYGAHDPLVQQTSLVCLYNSGKACSLLNISSLQPANCQMSGFSHVQSCLCTARGVGQTACILEKYFLIRGGLNLKPETKFGVRRLQCALVWLFQQSILCKFPHKYVHMFNIVIDFHVWGRGLAASFFRV